jgi:hypothetical protein
MYTYTLDKDLVIHLSKDDVEIDQVGPWDLADGADAWGTAVCAKYNDNPTFVYPGEEPTEETAE